MAVWKFLVALGISVVWSHNLDAANIVWTGTNGNLWDINTTANWSNAGVADTFFAGDNVTFDNSSSNGSVTLSGLLQPGSVTINNGSTAYAFSGSGKITGITGLLKTGTGTLTISNTNSYTGGTVISAGSIIVCNASALGTSGTTALGDGNTGANNAALLLGVSGGTVSFSRPVVVSNQGSGTITIGRTGTGNAQANISSSLTLNRDVTFQSASSGTLSLSGAMSGSGNATFNGGGVTALTCTTGSSGVSHWSGNVSVTGGSLLTSVLTGGSASPISVFANRNVDVASDSGVALTSATLGALTGAGCVGTGGTSAGVTLGLGGGNVSSTFDGVIGGGSVNGYSIGASLNLIKTGTGTLTLTGRSTYTGATTVSQGTLALSGTASINNTSSVSITPGASLDVSALNTGIFTLGGNQTLQAGRTSGFANDIVGSLVSSGTINIAGNGNAGTLTLSNNLTLNGGKLIFDLANVTTAGSHVNDLITLGGSLSLSGTTVIVPNLLNGSLANGTYTLISGGSSLASGDGGNLLWGGPAVRQGVSFDTTTVAGTVFITISGSSANLVWSGTNGGTWDTNSANWSNTTGIVPGTSDKFYALDSVVFNDASSNGSVQVSGTLQPAVVTVDNTITTYSLNGSGGIAGSASLLKGGAGVLLVSTSNAYTGGTVVTTGTLQLGNQYALGDVSGALKVDGGALDMNGYNASVGSLSGTAGVVITTQTNASVTLVTMTSGTSVYSGAIQDGAGTISVAMSGTGTQILGGTNAYTGNTDVNSGTLKLTGSSAISSSKQIDIASGGTLDASALGNLNVGSSQILVNHGNVSGNLLLGGTLGGRGVVNGSVVAMSGATVAPGASSGILTVENGFALNTGAHLSIQIGGRSAGFGTDGTDGYDQLIVSGTTITLGGDLQISLFNPSFDLQMASSESDLTTSADRFIILVNDTGSAIQGQFSNTTFTDPNFPDYANRAVSLGGQEFLICYDTDSSGNIGQGQSVTAYAVPEPTTGSMFVGAIGLLVVVEWLRKLRRERECN